MAKRAKIVIVHPEQDNQQESAWVSGFKHFLSLLLAQILGEKSEIVVLTDGEADLDEHLPDTVALVALFTGTFLEEEGLHALSNRFVEHKKQENSLSIGGRHTFLRVLQRPTPIPERLSFVSSMPSYDFYDIDPLTGDPRIFNPRLNSPTRDAYWLKLSDVCYDLAYILEHDTADVQVEVPQQRTVYLAPTSGDMVVARDALRRELVRRGYRVLPYLTIPTHVDDIERATLEDIKSCVLSVHLVGEDYGQILPNSSVSLLALQNEVAHNHTLSVIERGKEGSDVCPFHRLIWLSPDVRNIGEMQRLFVENLKSEVAAIEEAEVVEVSLAEFKVILMNNLAKYQVVRVKSSAQEEENQRDCVYLIHDPRDKEAVEPVASLLIDEGLEVLALSNEGSPAELRYEHQEHLRRCHGSLIYLKEASVQWFGSRLQDVFKAPAFGRTYPMRARAIFSESKEEMNLETLREHITIIHEDGAASESLRSFVKAVKI